MGIFQDVGKYDAVGDYEAVGKYEAVEKYVALGGNEPTRNYEAAGSMRLLGCIETIS